MSNSSRTKKSVKNISYGLLAQMVQMLLGFISRTIFIQYLSAEYLGVSSLFSNILMMLSLAELGIASAFVYELYKPLAEKDLTKVAVILKYFKKAYHWIGGIVLVLGFMLLPFLDAIIAEKPTTIVEDVRLLYVLYIINTASSYFFSYKIALLDADQNISLATKKSTQFLVLQNILQIVSLILFQNFLVYLLIQILCQFCSNVYISSLVDKKYPFLKLAATAKLEEPIQKNIIENVKSTFLIKMGGVLVNGTDNIFISMFVGLAVLGKYSNYVLLYGLVSSVLMIVFSNLKSSIGHFIVKENIERQRALFQFINFLNFLGFGTGSLVLYFLINDFIVLWIGQEYILPDHIIVVLSISFFMVGMQNAFWMFKSAYGFFKYGRYMVLGTALINLVLSYFLGKEWGIFGILLATIIARLCTNFWYDPYIVITKGLHKKTLFYVLQFTKYMLVLLAAGALISYILQYLHWSNWILLGVKTLVILFVIVLFQFIVFGRTAEMKKVMIYIQQGLRKIQTLNFK